MPGTSACPRRWSCDEALRVIGPAPVPCTAAGAGACIAARRTRTVCWSWPRRLARAAPATGFRDWETVESWLVSRRTRTVCWSGDSVAGVGSGCAVETPLVKAMSKPSKRTPLRGASSGDVSPATGVPGSAPAAAAAAVSAAVARLAAWWSRTACEKARVAALGRCHDSHPARSS